MRDGYRAHSTGTKARLSSLAPPTPKILLLISLPWGAGYLFFDRSADRLTRYVTGVPAAGASGVCAAGPLASIM